MNYQIFCKEQYSTLYEKAYSSSTTTDDDKREREAQKIAIKDATLSALRQYGKIEPSDIWKAVYSAHLHRKSGIELPEETIQKVVSADNSWKKSSGHAFEEIVKSLSNEVLKDQNIRVYLQKDISLMIKKGTIANEVRDISWLKEKLKSSSFDLFITTKIDNKKFVYGCVQSKTSIRDRVTRDREPSENAMAAFFWSVAFVMDGDFLRMPKFIEMVNGGGPSYPNNGWHGMYVFSNKYAVDRIYPTNINLDTFKDHAITAASQWLSQRQWMDSRWRADIKLNK
jgi:hypothetical protein